MSLLTLSTDEKTKKSGPVSILDPKTSQAVCKSFLAPLLFPAPSLRPKVHYLHLFAAIFLSQFKAKSLDELVKGILLLDETMFTAMHIDQMLKLIPSSDDVCDRREGGGMRVGEGGGRG